MPARWEDKASIILPTYNEKTNAVLLVQGIHEALGDRPHEVIVVDDDSPDGTHQAVLDLKDPRVKAVRRTTDRGLARSLRAGIDLATGRTVVLMDSDWNHQPHYLPFMLDAIEHYDCVSGSRFLYGGRMDSRGRHLLSWAFNVFTRAATGGQITDNLYGFVAIRHDVLLRCPLEDVFHGYGDYCIRLMFHLQAQGASILQFPAVNGVRRAGTGNSRFLGVFLQYSKAVAWLAAGKATRRAARG